MTVETQTHRLVPMHSKISAEEKQALLEKNNVILRQLPKILRSDPAVIGLDVKEGDVVKIERSSPTAGEIVYYRVVINE